MMLRYFKNKGIKNSILGCTTAYFFVNYVLCNKYHSLIELEKKRMKKKEKLIAGVTMIDN